MDGIMLAVWTFHYS